MKKNLLILTIASTVFSGCVATNNPSEPQQPKNTTQTAKKDFISETAMHDAVRARDIESVQFLIDQKIQFDTKDIYGYTPLHIAVRLQEYEIAKLLLENGADVNSVDNYSDTPLLDTTRDNYTELSKLLLCHKANRDVVDQHKISPLHNSIKNKNLLISEMLQSDNLDSYCNPQKEEIVEDEPQREEFIPQVEEPDVEIAPEIIEENTESLEVIQPTLVGLYDALIKEFQNDFEPWNAQLTKGDLVFRFNNPLALFESNKSDLKVGFTDILTDFFPRYIKIIDQYKQEIEEIKIEGHTSSEYKLAKTDEERYSFNQKLSQNRANAVHSYLVNEASKNSEISNEWIEKTFQPYGISYDNPIMNPDGTENSEASRRVEFKIVTITQ